MNEYWVEDEYSFYEIDPNCQIGTEKRRKRVLGKTEKKQLAKKPGLLLILLIYTPLLMRFDSHLQDGGKSFWESRPNSR